MCSPVPVSRLRGIPVSLLVWELTRNAIAEHNRPSHFIAAKSEYFEVSAVSTVMMLKVNDRA